MLKRFVLNCRKPDLDAEAFRRHWRDVHGPLLTSLPDYRRFVTRYDQNHVLAPGPVGLPFVHDGLTEIWQRSDANIVQRFADTELYRQMVQPDELQFADREHTVAFFADERTEIATEAAVKLIILTTRRAGLSPAEFHDRLWRVERSRLREASAFWSRLRGYQQNHVRADSGRGLAGASIDVPDDVTAIWFDTLQDAYSACAAAGPLLYGDSETFETDLTRSFFTDAVNFFDERPRDG